MNYSLTNDSPGGWFTPTNERQVPTGPWGRVVREPVATAPQAPAAPEPCTHERTVEQLRGWLSRQPFDGRVTVGDVLIRLGRAPRAGA